MKTKIFFCFLITVLLLNGCITEFSAKLPEDYNELLIVDGNITENSEVTFHLSKSYSINSPVIPSETLNVEAKLTVISSDGYESVPATYTGMDGYRLSVGELDDNIEYGIRIEYDGNIYQSKLSKPIRSPEIDSVSFNQTENLGNVFFHLSTHDESNEAKFYSWTYTEIWEIMSYYYTTAFFTSTGYITIDPAPYFYCWKTVKSNKYLIGSTDRLTENRILNRLLFQCEPDDNDRFSILYCLTVYQKAISKEAYDFYLNRIKLNYEMGGLYTPQPSELYGNISCITDPSKKAMGYVEISKNISQKRIWVYPYQIKRPYNRNCVEITHEYIKNFMAETGFDISFFLSNGYVPAGSLDQFTNEPIIWSTANCANCVAAGGSKLKPDFWPNDHE